jgi:tripartite-type tricarboxylate transporter receptor subunit TctC
VKKIFTLITACIFVGLFASKSFATYPETPITMVVPYAPGGSADALARLISQQLGVKLNATVVVMNRAGASGIIGESYVAQAKGDGYTLLYDATPLSINPFIQKLNFDPQKDLVPLTLVAVTPMLLIVPKASPFHTVQDVIAAAKASPGKLTFGSGGQGTVQYMAGELFSQGAGINMLHVPFKSGGPAIMATVGAQVDMMFSNLPAVSALVNKGELRALAITSPERDANFPDVPTIAERAIKGYQAYEWNGIFVPHGTPDSIVNVLQTNIKTVLEMPEVRERFDVLGSKIIASTPADFKKYMDDETIKWGAVAKKANIQQQ